MNSTVCDHNSLIKRQFMKIEFLENELAKIKLERDSLLGENERLCFQLQMMSEIVTNRKPIDHSIDGAINNVKTDNNLSYIDSNTTTNRQSISNSSIIKEPIYELSQQLLDKRVSALERKYGGIIAREAAIRIQRAFRTYRLQKRFHSIAIQALNSNYSNRDRISCNHINNSYENKRFSSISSNTTLSSINSNDDNHENAFQNNSPTINQQFECQRKREYRVGLNLFNKNPPERGIQYLIQNGFIEKGNSIETQALNVARFLLSRKGISKQMIGEYVATNHSFNALVLKYFSKEIDLVALSIDSALRKFQTFFRFPGEAQKIERLVDCFANRYIECNSSENNSLMLSRDSVFILSFAIIMLNTDLHNQTNQKSRMTSQQWIQNLRGVFSEGNLNEQFLLDIYQRIKSQEFKTGADHVTQVQKVQSAIVGKECPILCLPHRRLVCYCRLYEIRDLNKKERLGQHQREVFLFNDLLLITKLTSKAKSGQMAEYQYRSSINLDGLSVTLFTSPFHLYGIRLSRRVDDKLIQSFNARNELDRKRFIEDLKESILEMNEMENLRITKSNSLLQLNAMNCQQNSKTCEQNPKLELNRTENNPIIRRKSSSGSLDSGLSLPSRDHSPQQQNKTQESNQ